MTKTKLNERDHEDNSISGREHAQLNLQLDRERANAQRLTAKNQLLQKRLDEFEAAIEPRLKSILLLQPLRFAWRRRQAAVRARAESAVSSVKQIEGEHDADGAPTPEALVASIREMGDATGKIATTPYSGDMAIAVFAHSRASAVTHVLESLRRQGALASTHVWIDGDQGNVDKRARVDFVYECVKQFDVKQIHRNRGNFGFRKMMLVAMREMMESYDRVLFLEDDCFPVFGAVQAFSEALEASRNDPNLFSVYGSPFSFEGEENGSFRFQGWGWAVESAKLRSIWPALLDCYLMSESTYTRFVAEKMTPDIEKKIDVTPQRMPSDTLKKFFAWDETLCLLTALAGKRHRITQERTIYNFGADADASHFTSVQYFRKPPFNMVSEKELWDFFQR